LKNEPYYDNSLARFLLKRAFKSQRIGFDLFWNLKSEMKNPRYKYRFGLLLEAYCRGISRNMLKDLLKQVDVIDKLSMLAVEIKSNADNLSLVQVNRFLIDYISNKKNYNYLMFFFRVHS
jgi:phosphatidylinositol-4,5-bisphosphate 3-kinase